MNNMTCSGKSEINPAIASGVTSYNAVAPRYRATAPGGTALITGAGRRIGRGVALALAQDGFSVCIHYNSSKNEAEELKSEIMARGGKAETFRANLEDAGEAEGLIAACADKMGAPSVLINNASLFVNDRAGDFTADAWDRHQAVNLRAPALLARDFAKHLPKGERGVIINMLDQKLWNLNPDFFSYTISKAGLKALTETLAMALAPRIRVCGIAPGLTLPSYLMNEESFARARGKALLPDNSNVEDIVRTVRFLIATPCITGESVLVDGGEHLLRRGRDIMYDGE